MATKRRQWADRIYSPKGTAIFPHLGRPDTKFNAKGEYHVRLSIPAAEAQAMCDKLEELVDRAFDEKVKDLKPADAKKAVKALPFKPEEDDDGNETGNVLFNFKLAAKVEPKDKPAFTQKPAIFDAKGKQIDGSKVRIFGGSILKIAFDPIPYYVAKDKTVGVSLRLRGVQVLKLVSGSGSGVRFEAEEEGYEYDESEAGGFNDESDGADDAGEATPAKAGGAAGDEDEDF